MKLLRRALPWLVAALLLLCASMLGWFSRPDLLAHQERAERLAGALDSMHALEQTFAASRDDMCAIDLFARIPPGSLRANYTLNLSLFRADERVAEQRVTLAALQADPHIRFAFLPQPGSAGQSYRLRVESDAPPDTVSLLASADEAYRDGELFLDGAPSGRDLTFRAFSALTPAAVLQSIFHLRRELAFCLAVTLLAAAVGSAFLALLGLLPGDTWDELLPWSLGAGISLTIALYALLGTYAPWALAGIILLGLLRAVLRNVLPTTAHDRRRLPAPALHLLLLFLWAILVRLIQVEDLVAPLWVDGQEHIHMMERILQSGGIPAGLLYHVGYHILTVSWQPVGAAILPGGSFLPPLALLGGQWICALSGITLYPLARRFFHGSHNAALLAALALSTLAVFPSYLTNWGRYPFALGLALLPLLLSALIDLASVPAQRIVQGVLVALLLAATFLSHYGMLSFTISFALVWLAVERPPWLQAIWHAPARLALIAAAALLLALLIGLLRFGTGLVEELSNKLPSTIAESRQASADLDYGEILRLQLRGSGAWLALIGAAGGAAAAWRSRRLLALSAGWFVAQAVLTAAQAPLLGYALASYGNLLLALALPFSLLAGATGTWLPSLLSRLPGWLRLRKKQASEAVLSSGWVIPGCVLLAAAGGLTLMGLLNPSTLLFGPQDAAAAQWIQEQTGPDDIILINSNYWGSGKVIPSDGGGWIETFSGRRTVFLEADASPADLAQFAQQHKVRYIYLGRFTGFLSRTEMTGASYPLVYAQGGVEIYRVDSP